MYLFGLIEMRLLIHKVVFSYQNRKRIKPGKIKRFALISIISLLASSLLNAQSTDSIKTIIAPSVNHNCIDCSSTLLLSSIKEKDDWTVISGPKLKGIDYPAPPYYTQPFPSWEMDRYVGDSSYFKDCDWMLLPEKRKVVNTVSRFPIVFIKEFTTTAPAKIKLFVRMLYDNMAYLYIDSTRIPLSHHNADINRFIKEIRPELSSFVSIPATFNYSYNASYYAGDFFNLVLPAGNHTVKIELFNNANELGCIIKGMVISSGNEKIFSRPLEEESIARAGILIYKDSSAFPESNFGDSLYNGLRQAAKGGYWLNNLLTVEQDFISNDTLYLKKGDKINITPSYVTEFRNGNKDTAAVWGMFGKVTAANIPKKRWDKSFTFNATTPGTYALEITCESPADEARKQAMLVDKHVRIIKVR
jgi:hypothetical protein